MSHRDYLATLIVEEVANRAATRIKRATRRALVLWIALLAVLVVVILTAPRAPVVAGWLMRAVSNVPSAWPRAR